MVPCGGSLSRMGLVVKGAVSVARTVNGNERDPESGAHWESGAHGVCEEVGSAVGAAMNDDYEWHVVGWDGRIGFGEAL
ncbi:hypothetical protein MMC24_006532 [Lignoscripta atroalba]|nr:hypothetical protein [Lignoscripta atroalba]